jgi:hypothetical protein
VAAWFWYAVIAAILYGAHQIFTRLAAERIGEGLGGFVVEASARVKIAAREGSARLRRGSTAITLRDSNNRRRVS